jgi:hypothetical protein
LIQRKALGEAGVEEIGVEEAGVAMAVQIRGDGCSLMCCSHGDGLEVN